MSSHQQLQHVSDASTNEIGKNDATVDAGEGAVWILPKSSKPESYRVHLDVRNIHTGVLGYSGEATVNLVILQQTNLVVLHSKDQTIAEITAVNLDGGAAITVVDREPNAEYETIVVYFGSQLEIGTRVALTVKYETNLVTSRVIGFYQTSYEVDGVTRYVGATQFEETGARYAFPCYDGELELIKNKY
jgi:aminopeptidase N